MKPKSIKSLLALALLAPGALFAQTTAKTTPVGYETIELASGFNYVGLRLHQPTIHAGTLEVVNTSTLEDTGATISGITPSSTYLVEVVSGAGVGAVAEVLGSSISGGTITTTNAFPSLGVASGDKFVIRPAATLASVFGAENSAGLAPGSFGSGGADVVFVPDGSGAFDQYYYDADDGPGWFKIEGGSSVAVDGASVPLVYLDSMIVSSTGTGASSLTVSGEVKKESVYQVVSGGFNYIGSIYPVGATLESAFGGASTLAALDKGSFGAGGADVIFVPNGDQFDQYFYDADDGPGWFKIDGGSAVAVDASTVNLPSGLIFSNENSALTFSISSPTFYNTL